jgi:hypothetical protein
MPVMGLRPAEELSVQLSGLALLMPDQGSFAGGNPCRALAHVKVQARPAPYRTTRLSTHPFERSLLLLLLSSAVRGGEGGGGGVQCSGSQRRQR